MLSATTAPRTTPHPLPGVIFLIINTECFYAYMPDKHLHLNVKYRPECVYFDQGEAAV